MSKVSKQANFKSFTSKVKEADSHKEDKSIHSFQKPSYRYLQVRLAKEDANRLKSVLSSRDSSIQSVLVEAINLWMNAHGQSPISDPGTAREK